MIVCPLSLSPALTILSKLGQMKTTTKKVEVEEKWLIFQFETCDFEVVLAKCSLSTLAAQSEDLGRGGPTFIPKVRGWKSEERIKLKFNGELGGEVKVKVHPTRSFKEFAVFNFNKREYN